MEVMLSKPFTFMQIYMVKSLCIPFLLLRKRCNFCTTSSPNINLHDIFTCYFFYRTHIIFLIISYILR